jgi:hypothetical protein
MSTSGGPRRLWTGSHEDHAGSPDRSRSLEPVPARRVDVVSVRWRFAIAMMLAALGMVLLLAAVAALS